jgi:hypothetical protein
VVWEAPVDAVAAVAVDVSGSAPAGRALFSCGASPRGFGMIRDFSFNHLVRPKAFAVHETATVSPMAA